MITSSNSLFDTTILGQPTLLGAVLSKPAQTAPKSKASEASELPVSLWRHSLVDGEATGGHGLVLRSLYGVLGALSGGSVALAAWQMHTLFSGNCLHDAIAAFLQ